jgi:hypothetical protein
MRERSFAMELSERAVERVGNVFRRAELGDPRLVRRAVGLAEALASAPDLTLPRVWASEAQLEAGYHFLRNPRTGFNELMEAVQLGTRERALEEKRVLVLHDTTDVMCPSAEPDEVGHHQNGKAGFYVHHALCVSAAEARKPLGILWSEAWGRPGRTQGRARSRAGSDFAKLDERESDRWLEGVTEAQLWAQGCEQVVHVMDREADSYRLFEHMQQLGADFIVRLRHDRRTQDGRMVDELARAPIKLRRAVAISARKGKSMPRYTHNARAAREVNLTVRCLRVETKPPNYMPDSAPLELNVVQVLEENPPEGVEPIAWVLATSLPLGTRAQIEFVIDSYCTRWLVEEFHKALKTGCMFEKRQLESFESITSLLALCYPIACELLRVRWRSRQPGILASEVLRPTLLRCLRANPHPKARKLSENPTAEEALAVIAGLGGHIKYNGPPGWESLSAGYMKLLAFEAGWLAALESQKM